MVRKGPLAEYPAQKLMGKAKCPICKTIGDVRINKGGYAYLYCSRHAGCGVQINNVSRHGSRLLFEICGSVDRHNRERFKALLSENSRVVVNKPAPKENVELEPFNKLEVDKKSAIKKEEPKPKAEDLPTKFDIKPKKRKNFLGIEIE